MLQVGGLSDRVSLRLGSFLAGFMMAGFGSGQGQFRSVSFIQWLIDVDRGSFLRFGLVLWQSKWVTGWCGLLVVRWFAFDVIFSADEGLGLTLVLPAVVLAVESKAGWAWTWKGGLAVGFFVFKQSGFRIWDPGGGRIRIWDPGRTYFWNWYLLGLWLPVYCYSGCWVSCTWFWSSRVRLLCYALGGRITIHTTTSYLVTNMTAKINVVYRFDDILSLVMLWFSLSDVLVHLIMFTAFFIDAFVHLSFVILNFH